jgi:hypothetical protein
MEIVPEASGAMFRQLHPHSATGRQRTCQMNGISFG